MCGSFLIDARTASPLVEPFIGIHLINGPPGQGKIISVTVEIMLVGNGEVDIEDSWAMYSYLCIFNFIFHL